MPRYLAVDYVAEAVAQQKALLNRLLLSVPVHLEQMQGYLHRAVLPDSAYRQPWFRAKPSWEDKFGESEIKEELLELSHGIQRVEKYQSSRDTTVHSERYGTFEMVPSSNPSSQESVCDDVLAQLCADIDHGETGWETFTLQPIKDDPDEALVEEIESVHSVASYCQQMPQLHIMVSRLKPKAAHDPFLDSTGQLISQLNMLRGDLFLEETVAENKDYCSTTVEKEIFQKEKIVNVELDEAISLEMLQREVVTVERELPSQSQLLESLKLSQESVSDTGCTQTEMQNLLAGSQDKPEQLSIIPPPEELKEKLGFLFEDEKDSLVQLGCSTEGLLESPGATTFDDLSKVSPRPCSKLKSLDIDLKPRCIVTPRSMQELQDELWQREKMFGDPLIFKYPVPEPSVVQQATAATLSPPQAIEELGLEPFSMSTGLEPSLAWDPIDCSASLMALLEQADLLLEEGRPVKPHPPGTRTVEVYEQHDLTQCVSINNGVDEKLPVHALHVRRGLTWGSSYRPMAASRPNRPGVTWPSIHPLPSTRVTATAGPTPRDGTGSSRKVASAAPLSAVDLYLTLDSSPPRARTSSALGLGNTGQAVKTASQKVTIMPAEDKDMDKETWGRDDTTVSLSESHPVPVIRDRKTRKKAKCKIIQVNLTEPFQEVLSSLETTAKPVLSFLRQQGLLPAASHHFLAFSPDVTRFILKQHEKSRKDAGQGEGEVSQVYRSVVKLHCLVSAADVFLHCSLQSAIMHLTALQEKYSEVLAVDAATENQSKKPSLLCENLYKAHYLHQQRKIVHPKVAALCGNMADWLFKKKLKSPEGDPKMLIICKRDLDSLLACLTEAVSELKGADALVLNTDRPATYQQVMAQLEQSHCLILRARQIGEDFPWAHFALVVEYEYSEQQAAWRELCDRQHIRFLGLQTAVNRGPVVTNQQLSDMLDKTSASEATGQFTFIGSQHLTEHPELLQLLEARHNIVILERNYQKVSATPQSSLLFADIVVDQRTCILLQDLIELATSRQWEPLWQRVLAMSLKYETCWVLLYSTYTQDSKQQYMYAGHVPSTIARLHSLAAQFSISQQDFTVEILQSSCHAQTASLIRQIGDHTCQGSKAENWADRGWLQEDMSQDEQMLLRLPCLNSFSAQMMLRNTSMSCLLQLLLSDLLKAYPALPHKVIKLFWQLCHERGGGLDTEGGDIQCGVSAAPQLPSQGVQHQSDIAQHPRSTEGPAAPAPCRALYDSDTNSSAMGYAVNGQGLDTSSVCTSLEHAATSPTVDSQPLSQSQSQPNEFIMAIRGQHCGSSLDGDDNDDDEDVLEQDFHERSVPVPPFQEALQHVTAQSHQELYIDPSKAMAYRPGGHDTAWKKPAEAVEYRPQRPHRQSQWQAIHMESLRATLGVERAPLGVERAPLGVERAPLGVERAPLGVSRAPLGVERSPLGVERAPLGVERAPLGVERAPCPDIAVKIEPPDHLDLPAGQTTTSALGTYRDYDNSRHAKLRTEFEDSHATATWGNPTRERNGAARNSTNSIRDCATDFQSAKSVMEDLERARQLTSQPERLDAHPYVAMESSAHTQRGRRSPTIPGYRWPTQGSGPRTPVAPVTPTVRKPLQRLVETSQQRAALSTGPADGQPITGQQTQRFGSSINNRCKIPAYTTAPESPPMDLDWDDILVNPSQDAVVPNSFSGGRLGQGLMSQWDPETISLTPTKRRRLTFEKIPGLRSGQTRLSFL